VMVATDGRLVASYLQRTAARESAAPRGCAASTPFTGPDLPPHGRLTYVYPVHTRTLAP
jgi:hypothetical protein